MPIVFHSPGSVFLSLGSLTIRWYGVLIAGGFLVATWFASRLAKKDGLDSEKLVNLFLIAFLGGVLGARLYFVALNLDTYLAHPEQILATWLGGMSIHGGLIGGFIAGYLYAGKEKLPRRQVADIIGCILPMGQAIGRWGNFFNSEAFGQPVPANFPLAVFIPPQDRPAMFADSELFHPTFLYESVWNFACFGLLYYVLYPKLKRWPGVCFLLYLIVYSIGRLIIEPLRTDSIMAGSMAVPVVASAITAIVAAALIPVFVRKANLEAAGTTKIGSDK